MIDAALLCGVAGWVDAISYLRFDTFAGAMTGNTVLLGISVFKHSPGQAAFQLALIVVFLVFVTFAGAMSRLGVRPPMLLMVEGFLLVAASFSADRWIACLLAAAMGIQTSVVPRFMGASVNTVFITGNISRLGESLPEILHQPEARARGRLLALAWLSYGAGAALGCAGLSLNRYAMLPPVLTLCGVGAIILSQRRGA
jgi:uncharacterized membrane protein YoaK (UPF0700 family)